jgi:hypothetical protein
MGSGLLFLVLSVAFAFVGGMLLEKSLSIYRHNKTCDWLSEIAEEMIEQEKELPFGEFKKEN